MTSVLEYPELSEIVGQLEETAPTFESLFRAIPMVTGIYCQNCASALACDDMICGVCAFPTVRSIT